MKSNIFLILGLVSAITVISPTRTSAQQIIYSDSLTNAAGAPLNGTSPATDTTGATWIADSGINETATGATLGTGDSAYLPFTPILGDDYTLTLDILDSTGTTYVGDGFTRFDTTSQFYGNGQEAYMLLSGPNLPTNTTTVQYFNPGNDDTASGTYTTSEIFSINMQTTTSGNWTETFSVDGVQVGTYSNLPLLVNYVGFGDLNNSDAGSGLVTSFQLVNNSPSPEPSTWAMMFLAGLGLLVLVRRQKYLRA